VHVEFQTVPGTTGCVGAPLGATCFQGMGVVVVGVVAGVVVALALTRVMSSLLYDLQPTDLPTFAALQC
jgi:hypothetical protein